MSTLAILFGTNKRRSATEEVDLPDSRVISGKILKLWKLISCSDVTAQALVTLMSAVSL